METNTLSFLINVVNIVTLLMCCATGDIYRPSVCPGRGIPLRVYLPLGKNGFYFVLFLIFAEG